ncbi:MAG: hypothetical protein Q8O19_07410, partial [Rectinemataceae bacterium]|nr:hypothetical protein [Rectinemataceae bacterium]
MKGKNKPQLSCIYNCGRDCDSMNELLSVYDRSNAPDAQFTLCHYISILMGDYENSQRSSDAPGLRETRKKIKKISGTTEKLLSLLGDMRKPGGEKTLGLVGIAVRAKRGVFFDEARDKGCGTTIEDIFHDKFLTSLEVRLR